MKDDGKLNGVQLGDLLLDTPLFAGIASITTDEVTAAMAKRPTLEEYREHFGPEVKIVGAMDELGQRIIGYIEKCLAAETELKARLKRCDIDDAEKVKAELFAVQNSVITANKLLEAYFQSKADFNEINEEELNPRGSGGVAPARDGEIILLPPQMRISFTILGMGGFGDNLRPCGHAHPCNVCELVETCKHDCKDDPQN